jgi:hypothetical protein
MKKNIFLPLIRGVQIRWSTKLNNIPIINQVLFVFLLLLKIITIIYVYNNIESIVSLFNYDYLNSNIYSFFGDNNSGSGSGSQPNPLSDPTTI